ncbi:MAG: oxidoreductase [Brevinema sp.]
MSKKVALLTGASSGIGKDTALALIQHGWTVYGAARRVEMMEYLNQLGGKALKLDITDDASCKAAVEVVLSAEGHIDALINNAGYGSFGAIEDVSPEDARRQFDVNVFGLARMMQLVIPSMKTRRKGRIVNISSVVGKVSLPMMGWYCASKHAVEALSDAARMELKGLGVSVSVIEPGVVESEFKDTAFSYFDEEKISMDYRHIAKNMMDYQAARPSAPASTVSKAVLHAVGSAFPKARYVPNADAKFAQVARKWVGDGVYDFAVMKVLNKK